MTNLLIQRKANGYDWKKATLVEKSEFCTIQSQAAYKTDERAKELLDSLDIFFQGNDDSTMRISMSEAVGLIVAGTALLSQTPAPQLESPSDK